MEEPAQFPVPFRPCWRDRRENREHLEFQYAHHLSSDHVEVLLEADEEGVKTW
jgi:hypothetical protein